MKLIKLIVPSLRQIGNVRVSEELYSKISKIAKDNKVSNQDIVRAILENFIDEAKFN